MSKIFRYECRRLLWNKFFIGLAVVLLLYGALVLHAVTILGVSHTAPFSPWSFGDYLSRMLPLLWIGMLFFLTFYTSPKARRAAVLTDATPMPPRQYALARCAAALTGGVLLSLLCMGEAAVFYGRMFQLVRLGESAAPGSGDPSARPGVRTGERLAAGADPALAGVCVDGGTLPVYGLAAARRPGNLERTFFQQVPSSTWYFRPRLLYAGRSSYRSVHTVGRGHRPVDGSPRTIQKIISGRSLNDWR